MPIEKSFHHRATLKQTNKSFKSKHATKSELKDKSKGKVNRVNVKKATSRLRISTKVDRRNAAKLEQQKRREEIIKTNRFFEGKHGAPKIVAVIPLCHDVDVFSAVESIYKGMEKPTPSTKKGIALLNADRFKQKIQFIMLDRNFIDILDACKVADFTMFVLSAEAQVDKFGELCLKAIQSQCVPSTITIVQNLEKISVKKRNEVKKSLLNFIKHYFPEEEKIHEAVNVLRTICTQHPKQVSWRKNHPYMLAEEVVYEQNDNDNKDLGTLKVTGYVRGVPFSANKLVHLQNFGDFQLHQITSSPIQTNDKNEPNFMDNEQTWPTEEEMGGSKTSISIEELPDALPGSHLTNFGDEDEYEYDEIEMDKKLNLSNQLESDEEDKQLKEYISKREKQHKDDLEFPDEVDTPLDVPAKIRFQKYRGLQSFRTSPWDPYENLPIDYSRIFQFEHYKRTKSRILNQFIVGDGVKLGAHITLHISNVKKEVADHYDPSRPFIVFGLLEYEHKISVVNFSVTRNNEYKGTIKSKDDLILQCGFRRYVVKPIYSQNTQGRKSTNNVHKFEKFLNPGRTCIATIYGPIQFGNLPVTLYKELAYTNVPMMVATGSFLNVDPTRIIAKRIILTGHPFKVHKKSAVVRYMFFNPDDVDWFKPVQMTTKYGRIGHIKESLGTHGYMKCIFDSPITQQDTVMMNLYKRVYPKWDTTKIWNSRLKDECIISNDNNDNDNNVKRVEMEI
ncbi:16301_t:CDS:10 [Entrophospora sp. SA101]|nr:16301_t:CDS:10 [Entrophospora sp. SA101]